MIQTSEYMSQPVITADQNCTVLEVVELMNKHNIGSVVLVDSESLAGIITERDIIRKVVSKQKDPSELSATDVMTKDVYTVGVDASVMEISGSMKEHTMRRVVVVDDNEKPVGIITSRDLIGLLV